jgi:hypothetical protein
LVKHASQIVVRRRQIRAQGQRVLILHACVLRPAERLIGDAEIERGERIIGLDGACALIVADRLGSAPEAHQHPGEVAVHLGQVGLDGQRPLVLADGLFETVEPAQHIAETAVRLAKPRIGRQRLPIVRSGRFQASEPFQRRRDVMVGCCARGVDGERLVVMGNRGFGALAAEQGVGKAPGARRYDEH